jgi:hypothetical protein
MTALCLLAMMAPASEVKWRGVTFMTSRQGMGVTGGNPLGFDVGQPAGSPGSTLPGLGACTAGDEGVGEREAGACVPTHAGGGPRPAPTG